MYPIWEVPHLTGGIILALIATFHILPSHLTIGAMWFNVYVESKAYRENKPELLEFIKKYTLLLLIFSYILGSLSGVGIWFAATVASPRGISALIHNFVWGWATEWVFFIIEVLGIFVYYYTFNKVNSKTHLRIGWIFAIASWMTMVLIVGILAFQLTPGNWLKSGKFFHGFFNQSYWAQLLMRTSIMFTIAAGYAIVVASGVKNKEVRAFITRIVSRWGIAGLVLGVVFFFWYVNTLSESARGLLQDYNPQGLKIGIYISLAALILYFIYAQIKPLTIKLFPAIVAIFLIFIGIWSAERTREIIRKPYVVSGYMYSSQVIAVDVAAKGVESEVERFSKEGLLKISPFVPDELREINDDNMLEAGRLLALMQCSSCHTLDRTGLRPLPVMIERQGFEDAEEAAFFLEILGDFSYMPPFAGAEEEKIALGAYLCSTVRVEE